MLKIKDNVDLKELEKFDFVFSNDDGKYYFRKNFFKSYIEVKGWNKEIVITEKQYLKIPDNITYKLYDLIEAGLVEKVGE